MILKDSCWIEKKPMMDFKARRFWRNCEILRTVHHRPQVRWDWEDDHPHNDGFRSSSGRGIFEALLEHRGVAKRELEDVGLQLGNLNDLNGVHVSIYIYMNRSIMIDSIIILYNYIILYYTILYYIRIFPVWKLTHLDAIWRKRLLFPHLPGEGC